MLHSMFLQEITGRVADRGHHGSLAGVGEAALEGLADWAAGAEACVAGQARSAPGTKAGSAARGCGMPGSEETRASLQEAAGCLGSRRHVLGGGRQAERPCRRDSEARGPGER